MDNEHLDRFEALEKRLKAIEDKLMPQAVDELDKAPSAINSYIRQSMVELKADKSQGGGYF